MPCFHRRSEITQICQPMFSPIIRSLHDPSCDCPQCGKNKPSYSVIQREVYAKNSPFHNCCILLKIKMKIVFFAIFHGMRFPFVFYILHRGYIRRSFHRVYKYDYSFFLVSKEWTLSPSISREWVKINYCLRSPDCDRNHLYF